MEKVACLKQMGQQKLRWERERERESHYGYGSERGAGKANRSLLLVMHSEDVN